MKIKTIYAYKNTTSSAGMPVKYEINTEEIDIVKKWNNYYGNPSYVYHMSNGDTYYLEDDYSGLNNISCGHIYCKRKKDMFIKLKR